MKKTILILAVLLASTVMYAQKSNGVSAQKLDLSVGIDAGLPLSNLKQTSKFGIGGTAKLAYNIDNNVAVTFQTGYISFAGKTETFEGEKYKYPSLGFIPFKFGGRYTFEGGFYAEPQLGFTHLTAKGEGGATGFAYAINAGYRTISGVDLSARYEGVSKEGTVSFIGLRAAYSFSLGK